MDNELDKEKLEKSNQEIISHFTVLTTSFFELRKNLSREIDNNLAKESKLEELFNKNKPTLSRATFKTQKIEDAQFQLWANFPRNSEFYDDSIRNFCVMSSKCIEDTIKMIFGWLPFLSDEWKKNHSNYYLPNLSYISPQKFTFSNFLSNHRRSKEPEIFELIETITDLCIADLLSNVLDEWGDEYIDATIKITLKELAFVFFKPRAPISKIPVLIWNTMRSNISNQWKKIVSILTRCGVSLDHLISQAAMPKEVDVVLANFKGLEWITVPIQSGSYLSTAKGTISEFVSMINNAKNPKIKSRLVFNLSQFLHTLDLIQFWSEVQEIISQAKKWKKMAEVKKAVVQLEVVILACGNVQHFQDNFNKFFSKKIAKGISSGKEVQFWLNATLMLLRGKYLPPRAPYKPEKMKSKVSPDLTLPYAFVPLGHLGNFLEKYLSTVVESIFKKGKIIPNGEECIEQLVQILLQIAAHSLTYVITKVLPAMYNDKQPFHNLIAIIVTKRILDENSGFWESAGCNPKPESLNYPMIIDHKIHTLSLERAKQGLEPLVLNLLLTCDSSVGIDQMGSVEEIFPLTTHLSKNIVLSNVEGDDTLQLTKVVNSIERWKTIIKRQPDNQLSKAVSKNDRKIKEMVLEWLRSGKVTDISSKKTQETLYTDLPKKEKKPETPEQSRMLAVFRESVRAIPLVLSKTNVQKLMQYSKLLRHSSGLLAESFSHTIQEVMIKEPVFREKVLQHLITTLEECDWDDIYSIRAILRQILLAIDIWIYQKYSNGEKKTIDNEKKLRSISLGKEDLSQMVNVDVTNTEFEIITGEIEASVFIYLAHPSYLVHSLVLELVHALSCLSSSRNIAYVLDSCEQDIMEKARYSYLLDSANGVPKTVVLSINSPLPKIEEVSQSTHTKIWTYVLAELGNAIVDESGQAPLERVRRIVTRSNVNKLLKFASTKSKRPEIGDRFNISTLRNYWSLSLSLFGVPTYLSSKKYMWNETKMKIEEQIRDWLIDSKFWDQMLVTNENSVVDAIKIAAGSAHWSSLGFLLKSLSEWNKTLSKSNKLKIQPHMVGVMRKIVQNPLFPKVLEEEFSKPVILPIIIEIFKKSHEFFSQPPSKLPTTSIGTYFLDDCMLLKRVSDAIFKLDACSTTGPLRNRFQPNHLIAKLWSINERVSKVHKLLGWCGYGVWSTERVKSENEEINRVIKTLKDEHQKENKKKQVGQLIQQTHLAANYAIESIAQLGPFIGQENELNSDLVKWAVYAEHRGFKIFRWLIGYHFGKLTLNETFFKNFYVSSTEESIIYINSLYDIFLPFSETNAPRSGITMDMSNYLQQKTLDNAKAKDLNNSTASEEDLSFSKEVSVFSGSLWHLALFNMSHVNPIIRSKSYEFLCRISPFVPSALVTSSLFTIATVTNYRDKEDNEWKNTSFLHESLLSLRKTFNPKAISSSKETALKISEIIAKYRPSYTEYIFKESFLRWDSINSYSMKKWVILFLSSWSQNINLGDSGVYSGTKKVSNLLLDSEDVFLSRIYHRITYPEFKHMSDDVLVLWGSLSHSPNNLQMCIDYLLTKACLFEEHLEIARTIILHLYKINPEKGVLPLVTNLSFSGIKFSLGSSFFESTTDSKLKPRTESRIDPEDESDSTENSDEMTSPVKDDNQQKRGNDKLSLPLVSSLIIIDILREPPKHLVPHYSILINYAILEGFNTGFSNQSHSILELLKSIFISIKTSLDNNKSKGDNAIDLIGTLDSIIYSIEIQNFEIDWAAYRYSSHFEEKKKVILETTRTQMTLQHEMQYNEEFKVLEPWASKPIKPSELVTNICQCFEIIKPNLIAKWGQEAFSWFKNSKDNKLSITALEIYKSILEPITNDTSFTLIARLRDIFRSLEYIKKSQKEDEQQDKNTLLLFGKAEQILLTLLKSIPFLEDFYELHRMFWLAMAILKSEGNSYLINLHPLAYDITIKLFSNNFYSNFSSVPEYQQLFLQYCSDFGFTGIQHRLLIDLYRKQTSNTACRLAVMLPNISPPEMVDRLNNDDKRFAVNIMSVLPWFHYQLIYVFHSTDEEEKSGFLRAKEFAQQLEKADAPYPLSIKALLSYSEGNFNDNGDGFVDTIVSEIYNVDGRSLSHIIGFLYEKIIVKVSKINYSNSVLNVVNCIFKKEEENISEFTNKLVGHFGTTLREASLIQSPLAKELLGRAVRLTYTLFSGNIEPLLKPFKPPSQMKSIKQTSKSLNHLLKKEKEDKPKHSKDNLNRKRHPSSNDVVIPSISLSHSNNNSPKNTEKTDLQSIPSEKKFVGVPKLELGNFGTTKQVSSPRKKSSLRTTPRFKGGSMKQGMYSQEFDSFSVINIQTLLTDQKQRYFFEQFLNDNKIVSNEISFYDAVQTFSHFSDTNKASKEAKNICEKYLVDNAPEQIDLPSNIRDTLVKKYEQNPQSPSSNLFHSATDKITEKLRDLYLQKFRMSDCYLDLLSNYIKQSGLFDEDDFDSFDWQSSEQDEDESEDESEDETTEDSKSQEKENDFSDLSQLASGLDLSSNIDLDSVLDDFE